MEKTGITTKDVKRVLEVDNFLTIKECVAATGFHESYFGNLIREGKLKAEKKDGRRWFVRQSVLDTFLNNKEVKPLRDPNFTKNEPTEGPQVSLLTQVQMKDKQILDLRENLTKACLEVDELKQAGLKALEDYRHSKAVLEKKLDAKTRKIDDQKEELEKLEDIIDEHNAYLRQTLDSVLQYLMK